jgi:hypothetical protein
VIIRRPHQQNFTVIDNQAIHDADLSLKATGLLCYLLSLPPDWDISGRALANMKKDGRDAVYSGLKELEESGYVRRYHESVYNGTNISETGKDRGRVVECCDVTERPHDFGVSDNPSRVEIPPPVPDPIFETPANRDDEGCAENPLAENPDGGINRITEEPNYGKSSHNKVLSLQSTFKTKDRKTAHTPARERLTATNEKPMSPESDAFMRRLLLEREVPDQLKASVDAVLSMGEIPQWVGSELIDQLKDLPKCKVDDGMVTARMWNGSSQYFQERIPRKDFERIKRQLEKHNQNRSIQPAVFVVNGRDMTFHAIAEHDPAGQVAAPKHQPDTDRDKRPVHEGIRSLCHDLAGAFSAEPAEAVS